MAYGDAVDRYEVENIVNDAVRRAKRELDEHASHDKQLLQGQIADLQEEMQRLREALAAHRTPYDEEMALGHTGVLA